MNTQPRVATGGAAHDRTNTRSRLRHLVRGGYLIIMDTRRSVYACGAVAIGGNAIGAAGDDADIVASFRPRRVIDPEGGVTHGGTTVVISFLEMVRAITVKAKIVSSEAPTNRSRPGH